MEVSLPGLQYAVAGWVNAVTSIFRLRVSTSFVVGKGEKTDVCR